MADEKRRLLKDRPIEGGILYNVADAICELRDSSARNATAQETRNQIERERIAAEVQKEKDRLAAEKQHNMNTLIAALVGAGIAAVVTIVIVYCQSAGAEVAAAVAIAGATAIGTSIGAAITYFRTKNGNGASHPP